MSDPFIGQIIQFGGNFAPRGWALCDGQLLSISSNQALFSILGTTYGGDGRTTFGLPDMRGRVPMGEGQGPGLTNRPLGQKAGNETTVLSEANLPSHTHGATLNAEQKAGTDSSPNGKMLSASGDDTIYGDPIPRPDAMLSPGSITVGHTGSGVGFSNEGPYQVVNFIIALQGTFPSRN